VPTTSADVQSEGAATLIAEVNNDGASLDCGLLPDQPLPADGAVLATSVHGSPPALPFTSDRPDGSSTYTLQVVGGSAPLVIASDY